MLVLNFSRFIRLMATFSLLSKQMAAWTWAVAPAPITSRSLYLDLSFGYVNLVVVVAVVDKLLDDELASLIIVLDAERLEADDAGGGCCWSALIFNAIEVEDIKN